MRKVAAAALAVPILAIIYLPVLARRSIAARLVLIGTVGVVVAIAAVSLAQPAPTTATPPAPPITALPDAAFRQIATGTNLRAGVPIQFSEPMDPVSVEASLMTEPATPVKLDWSADHTSVTVLPKLHWAVGSYHVVTVQAGALAASGRPMSSLVRVAFVTRQATTGRIELTKASGDSASTAAGIRLTFDRPVARADVAAALHVSPDVTGTLTAIDASSAAAGAASATTASAAAVGSGSVFLFTPDAPLVAGQAYDVSLPALADVDGAAVSVPDLSFSTATAPAVVRFRPVNGASKVDRKTALSVRFTMPMAHASTRSAFTVTANGTKVAGTLKFAEGNSVVVFTPASALPASATVVMTVGAGATSASGIPVAAATTATIHTAAAPKPVVHRAATPTRKRSTSSSTTTHTSGGAVGGGSWGAVETYYLRLMNCTRTGGWVTSSGSCSSPGGRSVAALRLDSGISSKVSRPYAKYLAVHNACSHFLDGNPGNRLARAGYHSYRWAENIGCRSGNAYSAVLGSHLFFQDEKPSGGHYVNLMNAAYDRCGIGVWVSGGNVRLVIDFYHP